MNTNHRYRPFTYFALAFVITWLCGFMVAWQSHQGNLSHQSGNVSIILLLLAYMGPLIAAFIMMYVFCDKAFRSDFFKRIYDLRLIHSKSLVFVILFLPVALFISILISIAFGQPIEQLGLAEELQIFKGQFLLSLLVLFAVPLLEELGWRGYGVDSLAASFNLFKTSLIFGALWSIWHLPAVFIAGSYHAGLWAQHPIFAINFFVGIIPLAIIMNYVYYINQRSIILIALFHFMVNFSSELFAATQVSKGILTFVLTVVAAILIIRNKEFFFKEKMNLEIQSST